VLLPCRDAAATLDAALESLVHQTFSAFEVVAVDDGSGDGTPACLDAWAARDARIRVARTAGGGIVAALTRAAALARGTLLARMDTDDVAHPERFAAQTALLDANPRIAACGTGVRYFPRAAVRDGARRYERWINGVVTPEEIDRDLFVECPLPHPTVMMRRAAFEVVGGYRDTPWPEDYDLVFRLRGAGFALAKVPEILLDWRESAGRLSRVDPRYAPEAFQRCKAHYLGPLRAGARPIVVWGAGPVGKSFARALIEASHTVAAFVEVNPRKLGQTVHGAPVVPPAAVADYRGCYVVAAVGQPGARDEIRAQLTNAGLWEPDDFCAVA
jgi:glycosyltransferase involved in cell wall biosynthesis